jgi:hypothetical protein
MLALIYFSIAVLSSCGWNLDSPKTRDQAAKGAAERYFKDFRANFDTNLGLNGIHQSAS